VKVINQYWADFALGDRIEIIKSLDIQDRAGPLDFIFLNPSSWVGRLAVSRLEIDLSLESKFDMLSELKSTENTPSLSKIGGAVFLSRGGRGTRRIPMESSDKSL